MPESLSDKFENGFDLDQSFIIEEALNHPSGLVLISGLAPSRVSRALYALVKILLGQRRKVTMVEFQPLEKLLGAQLLRLKTPTGESLATALGALSGQAAPVIMIDCLRDPVSAQQACDLALTGRLVLAGINDVEALCGLKHLKLQPIAYVGVLRLLIKEAFSPSSNFDTDKFEVVKMTDEWRDALLARSC